MQLKIYILLNKIKPHSNNLILFEILSYNLFAVHDVGGVVETYGSVGVVAVLTDQIRAMAYTIAVDEVFLLDY